MAWNGGVEWLLDLCLIILLGTTLFHARRLERALGVLKRDRAALEDLVAGFNASTRQAEIGIERLRATADGAGRQIAKQVDAAGPLKDDLMFLIERGERLADRMEVLVRASRDLAPEPSRLEAADYQRMIGRHGDLMHTETPHADFSRTAMAAADFARHETTGQTPAPRQASAPDSTEQPRLRSQAERDLLKALRMAR
jgi:hypothetical protein